MKKEVERILRELKRAYPDAVDFSADAGIASWVDYKVRYTAHVMFSVESGRKCICAVCESSVETLLEKMLPTKEL